MHDHITKVVAQKIHARSQLKYFSSVKKEKEKKDVLYEVNEDGE